MEDRRIAKDELFAGIKDFEIVSENRLRSTSIDPWIEIKNVRERIGRLHSVVYKVKPINEDDEIKTQLYYADTEQKYNSYRSFVATFKRDATIIKIPDYVGPIDKLRLDLTSSNDMILEIEEISLNTDARFSAPLMMFVYVIWCLVIFLEPRTPHEGPNPETLRKSKKAKLKE